MRYKTYTVRSLIGQSETFSRIFEPAHFQEAGLPSTPEYGMVEMEALHLMNKWNRNQSIQNFVYFLNESDL